MKFTPGRLQASTDFFTIYFHKDGFLYVDWTGFQSKSSVYDGCEKMLHFLKLTGVSKVINDNSNAKGIWDHNWVAVNWFPKMEKAGIKKFAWVLSPESICRFEATSAIMAISASSLVKTFENVETAKEWILNTGSFDTSSRDILKENFQSPKVTTNRISY